MIKAIGSAFILTNEVASYVIDIHDRRPTLLHYGGKVKESDIPSLGLDYSIPTGRAVYTDGETTLNLVPLEASGLGKGDYLSPSYSLERNGKTVFDFRYEDYWINEEAERSNPFPMPRGGEELVLLLRDKEGQASLELHYIVYPRAFARYATIHNEGADVLYINHLASFSLDFPYLGQKGYFLSSSWGAEAQAELLDLPKGELKFKGLTGASSDCFNPFFAIFGAEANKDAGEVYGFNLMYSGSYEISVSRDSFYRLRVQEGLPATDFHYGIKCNKTFYSPLAILTYSDSGANGLRKANADFIHSHVIREPFVNVPRPIVYNNWEATFFDFNTLKIHSLVDQAADLGVELFVLDDGWFGKRNDDKAGLGDWTVNKKKVFGGMDALADYVHERGLKFGLWFEPEMINPDSDLYRAHPEYVLSERKEPALSRNQLILDLRQRAVQDYIVDTIVKAIKDYHLDYIKWDCNRAFSDIAQAAVYDYYLGLYSVLARITKECPDTLFENCASGGMRFDLGMMSFFPYTWVSDDTDSYERAKIQRALSLGYPFSTFSNHVSAKISHQMFRKTTLGTKFDVAMLGALGYELDLNHLSGLDQEEIKEQIAYYKEHRDLALYGDPIDLSFGENIVLASKKGEEMLISFCSGVNHPSPSLEILRVKGLEEETDYSIATRPEYFDIRDFGDMVNQISPVKLKPDGAVANMVSKVYRYPSETTEVTLTGAALAHSGLKLGMKWSGSGISKTGRIMFDFSARAYYLRKVK